MDIPPPPEPPPFPDGPPHSDGSSPPPPPPYEGGSPYGSGSPYEGSPPYGANSPYGSGTPYEAGAAYAGPPPYARAPHPYGRQPPYGPGPGPGPGPGGPPYGAPGPYGYGYPPPQPAGWYAERPTNGLAIASLVTSFVVWCLPVGLVLGIFALRQIRRRGESGKGLAVAGMSISGLGTVLSVSLFVLALVGALDDGNTTVQDLKVGQCFNTVDQSLSDYSDGARSTRVNVVSCDSPHDAETYAVLTLDAGAGGSYPGRDLASETSTEMCVSAVDSYLGGPPDSDTDVYYYMPSEDGWNGGDHSVTCFLGSWSGKTTGSLRSGAQGPGIGV